MSTENPKPETQDPKPETQPAPTDWQKALVEQLTEIVVKYTDPNEKPPEQRYTSKGSPCSCRWDDEWIAKVDAAEQRLERRICGARTLAGTPCELAPNHENGRCRFHGGFPLTGGQERNRNAAIQDSLDVNRYEPSGTTLCYFGRGRYSRSTESGASSVFSTMARRPAPFIVLLGVVV